MTVAQLRPVNTDAPDTAGRAPIHNPEAETAVIGAALITTRIVEPVCTETGLRPEHFRQRTLGQLWAAIVRRVDHGDGVDALLLSRDLDGTVTPERIDQLAAAPPVVGNARQYAQLVVDAYRWETRRQAHWQALDAIGRRDEPGLHAAEAAAQAVVTRGDGHATTPGHLADRAARRLQEPRLPGLPLPWPTLGRVLAMRRGQTTVIAGHTSMGKSIVSQVLAEHVGRKGMHAVIWTNEMSEDELVARTVQRATGVPDRLYLDGRIPAGEEAAVLDALAGLPYGAVECAGWTAVEIGRHIRQVKPALAVVDHFHQIPGSNVREQADDAVIALTTAAAQAGTHLVVVSQLNHTRDRDVTRTPPALRDLRSTGLLQHLPNNVVLFHRDEEEFRDDDRSIGRAVTTERGLLHLAKQRGGRRDVFVPVRFDSRRLTILEMAS